MANIVAKHPDYFPAFVASLPMNDVPAALKEMDRAITQLRAKGIQIFTNVLGRPLDGPEFYPNFDRMANPYDLPIWVHPTRPHKFADYATEKSSKFEIWWLCGWPYETSAFMARLVFSGIMDKLPGLRIITHHLGAMAPFFDARISLGMDQIGTRASDEDYTQLLKGLSKRPINYSRCSTAAPRSTDPPRRSAADWISSAMNHVLFGTDCPFDPKGGPMFIRESIKAITSLK